MMEPGRPQLAHDASGRACTQPGAFQMDRDNVVEVRFGHLAHGGVPGETGVVDHNVQGPEIFDGGIRHCVHVRGRGHIADDCHNAVAQRLRCPLQRRGIQIGENDVAPLGSECPGCCEADAPRSAGDHARRVLH